MFYYHFRTTLLVGSFVFQTVLLPLGPPIRLQIRDLKMSLKGHKNSDDFRVPSSILRRGRSIVRTLRTVANESVYNPHISVDVYIQIHIFF